MTTEMMPTRPRSRFRTFLLNLALGVGSIAIALLLAELAVRLVAPQQLIQIRPDLWQPSELVGWDKRPNVDAHINTGGGEVRVVTDVEGNRVSETFQRGPCRTGEMTCGLPVLLLGDSFMEALQVEWDDSFAGMLEERLSQHAGMRIPVRNSGVSGWDPNHYLLRARSAFERDDYALVVTALFVGNDVVTHAMDDLPARVPTLRHEFRVPRGIRPADFVDAFLRPLNDRLETRSQLFMLARNNLESLRMRAGLHAMQFPEAYVTSIAETPRWDVTADLCLRIAQVAEEHGVRTVFVLIPDAIQVAPDELDEYLQGYGIDPATVDLQQPNRLLTAELRERGLTVVDPLPEFIAANERGVHTHGDVDAHFTVEGHRLLTDLVEPLAREMMRVEASGSRTISQQAMAQ